MTPLWSSRSTCTCVPGPSALGGSTTTTSPALRPLVTCTASGTSTPTITSRRSTLLFATTNVCAFVGIGSVAQERRRRHRQAARHVAHLHLRAGEQPGDQLRLARNADDDLERAASRVHLRSDAVHLAVGDEAGQRIDCDDDGLAHLHLAEIARRDRRAELEHRIVHDRVERRARSDDRCRRRHDASRCGRRSAP